MPNIRIILLALLLPLTFSLAQNKTATVQIDTVIVRGNKKTRPEVILREIPFSFPCQLTQNDLLLIQKRIRNLFLFNRVELQVDSLDHRQALVIQVTEIWYFYPVPIFFLNERSWSKISYGLSLIHFNFRGRNEKIMLGGWLGYNPSLFINYQNPWFGGKKKLILGFSLYKKRTRNKLYSFDEQRRGIEITLGKRFNLFMSNQILFSLQRVELPMEYQMYSASGNGKDWVPKIEYQFFWDRRDLYEYPKKGFYIQYNFSRTGFSSNQPEFWRFQFDHRIYLPLYRELSLGARNLLITNQGKPPIYDLSYFGFEERIRGYFYRVFTANNLMLQSVEFRFPLIPIRYFTWNAPSLLSAFTANMKYGLSAGIFADTGIVWNTPKQFALTNFFTGIGAGLHFHVPFLNLLRLEYVLNDQGQGEIIFDISTSF